MLNISRLRKSFRYACAGIAHVYREEQNFRVQIYAGSGVLVAGFILGFNPAELSLLVVAITLVLAGEMINSAMERFLDALKPRVEHYVQVMKDIMAGIVFICAAGAFAIGCILFIPRIVQSLHALIVALG